MTCNVSLIKKHNRLKSMQVKVHSKKIQPTEVQLQFDPTDEHVRTIFSKSQGKRIELF